MTREVVVIGGGLAGISTAIALWRRGYAVNLLEREAAFAGASGAAAGMLAPQYEVAEDGPFFRRLVQARAAYPAFVALVEELAGEPVPVRWNGMLVANRSPAEHEAAARRAAWQVRAGCSAFLIDAAEAVRIEPTCGGRALSYLWLPREGSVDPQALAGLLALALQRTGIRVVRGVAARAVTFGRSSSATGVELADGRALAADDVVLAAGAWTSTVGSPGVRLPMRPVRGHLLRFRPDVVPGPIVAGHGGRYLVPRSDGSVLAGSTMESVGLDRAIDDAAVHEVHRRATQLMPSLGRLAPTERWTGLRPVTADGLPAVGRDPEVRNLWHATGYGRNGILFAPLAGRTLARQMEGTDPPPGWDAFAPGRFPRAGVAVTEDGVASERRVVREDSVVQASGRGPAGGVSPT